jgi:hypothetical protein
LSFFVSCYKYDAKSAVHVRWAEGMGDWTPKERGDPWKEGAERAPLALFFSTGAKWMAGQVPLLHPVCTVSYQAIFPQSVSLHRHHGNVYMYARFDGHRKVSQTHEYKRPLTLFLWVRERGRNAVEDKEN